MSHAPLPPPSFAPDFSKGLVPAIAQDAATGEVLMLAYMEENAWNATLRTGEAHYWSRSRRTLWHKGESSGNVQIVKGIRLDCDSDAVVLEIEQIGGAACHTGRCGWCKSLVLAGEYTVEERHDTRSEEDRREGRICLCCTYPDGDMTVVVPRALPPAHAK